MGATPRHALQPGVLSRSARMRRLRVYPTSIRAFQGTISPFEQWFGAGTDELATTTAGFFASSGNTQTYTTAVGIDPPANTRLVAVARAGRSGHTTAFSWSFTASGGLGAMTVSWAGADWPSAGNSFGRQMAIAYVDVGASPPTGVTVTVDAWSTTDVGAYGVAVFCLPAGSFNAGSWLAQTPVEAYSTSGSTSTAVALAAASTGRTYAVTVAEDNLGVSTWWPPEPGWEWVARSVGGYYLGNVRVAAAGDSDGATSIHWTPGDNNTATAVIFEVAPAGGSLFTQGVAGSASSSGSLVRLPGKALAGSAASGGALTRQPAKALAGAAVSAGSLLKRANKALSGSVGSSGALSSLRLVLIALAGSAASSGALVRSVRKSLAGAASSGGALTRLVSKALSGSAASSGALSSVRTKLVALAGAATSSGALTRRPARALAGAASSAGSLVKQPNKLLSGAGSSSGALTKTRLVVKALVGAATSVGTLNRRISKGLSGSATPTGSLAKLIGKILSGVASSLSSLASIVSGSGTVGPNRHVTVAEDGHTMTQQEQMFGTVYDGGHTSTVEES